MPDSNGLGSDERRRFSITYSVADARWLCCGALALELALVAAYLVSVTIARRVVWFDPFRVFLDLNREATVPAWFSSVQLFAIGLLLLMQAAHSTTSKRALNTAGFAFLFLSMDEGAAFHDRLYAAAGSAPQLQGREYLAWTVPYALVLTGGLVVLRDEVRVICRRFPSQALLVALGAGLFVAGGVVVEILTHFVVVTVSVGSPTFHGLVVTEEFLEMAGVTVMLYGSLMLGVGLRTAAGESPISRTRSALSLDRHDSREPRSRLARLRL